MTRTGEVTLKVYFSDKGPAYRLSENQHTFLSFNFLSNVFAKRSLESQATTYQGSLNIVRRSITWVKSHKVLIGMTTYFALNVMLMSYTHRYFINK